MEEHRAHCWPQEAVAHLPQVGQGAIVKSRRPAGRRQAPASDLVKSAQKGLLALMLQIA